MLGHYLEDIHKTYKAGDATEPSYYPDLKKLLESFLKSKGVDPNITIEAKKAAAGKPDFTVRKSKELIGYVEAKDLPEDLGKIENSEQIKRYKEKLPNFVLTNYFDFWLWRRDSVDNGKGEWVKKVRIGQSAVLKKANITPPAQNEEGFYNLFDSFFSYYIPERKTAKSLAIELASRAQLLPSYIVEELNNDVETEIDRIYEAFREYLIQDLTKEDFADISAQTITYGLFAARLRYKGKDFNRSLAADLIPKNIRILHDTFHLVSHDDLTESLSWIVDDMATVLAHADIDRIRKELHRERGEDDPLIHFYETFLAEYDPKKRKSRGVYYTPSPVVSYITRSINHLLKEKFGKELGFASDGVTLLDPAAGTLTFPANAIAIAKEEIDKSSIAGSWLKIVQDHILKDFYAFEILMAPYIIGHLKTSLLLEDLGYTLKENDRFQLYLTNTLDLSDVEQTQMPFVAGLSEEARKAGEVKREIPILVVTGNPPYSVSSSNVIEKGSDFYDLYESYKEIVRREERNIQPLSDDYIKFIAFAHWKVKQAGQGIVGMITNNSYLDGLIHRDMRRKLAEDFDEIYVLNLHGDLRRGFGEKEENVFDIQQGVSIVILVKGAVTDKSVSYAELRGLRDYKYKFLEEHNIEDTDWTGITPSLPDYFFIPIERAGEGKYSSFVSIKDIFSKSNAGIATGKDNVLVNFDKDVLVRKLTPRDKESFEMSMKSEDVDDELIDRWYENLKGGDIGSQIRGYSYRPFDTRFVIYNNKVLQRARQDLMDNFLFGNLGICTTKQLSTQSFQHALVTNSLTDRCYVSLRTREVGYVFPLFVSSGNNNGGLFGDSGVEQSNFDPGFWQKMKGSFIETLTPWTIFYYIYGTLYSNTYRKKYNEFLKRDFPRIPFTKDDGLFIKISELGKALSELHLLKFDEVGPVTVRFIGEGQNLIEKQKYDAETRRVYINNDQYFEGVTSKVWDYYIGGYQVLDKWLKDRKGRYLTIQDAQHYLKVVAAISRTIEIQKEINRLYPKVEETLI